MELIFAEFGKVDIDRTLESFRKYFKGINVTLYTDTNYEQDGVEVIKVDPPFDGERYGNRCNDFYKVKGLLNSRDDWAVAVDADMRAVSPKVKSLEYLTDRFGLCLPANPRHMVGVDQERGADSDGETDAGLGCAHAVNMSPIAFNPRHKKAAEVLTRYCFEMLDHPRRGPLVMWRALRDRGFSPCLLPLQWCVCKENCGIGNELILHEGHPEVRKFYEKT